MAIVIYALVCFHAQGTGNKTLLCGRCFDGPRVTMSFPIRRRAGAGPCRDRPSMVVGGALPKIGRVVANEIHIPVGKAVVPALESPTCCTNSGCRNWREKSPPSPGIRITSGSRRTKPGTYLGICSEFCGTQHAWMHFLIVAEPEASLSLGKAQLAAGGAADKRFRGKAWCCSSKRVV
jgi:hypothetical protein